MAHIGLILDPPHIQHSISIIGNNLAKQLIKLGHKISWLAYGHSGEKFNWNGVDIYPDTEPPTRYNSVKKFIEESGVDILYAHGSKNIFAEGIKAAHDTGKKYIAHTFWSYPVNEQMNSATFEMKDAFGMGDLENADLVLVCNKYSLGIGNKLGIDTVRYLSNGVDTSIFKPEYETEHKELAQKMGIQKEDFVFLFVGSNQMNKDPYVIVRAFSKLSKEQDHIKLILCCKKSGDVYLPDYIKQYEINSNNIIFIEDYNLENINLKRDKTFSTQEPNYSFIPHNKMPLIYNLADCIVSGSVAEGQSCVFLEANACGKPILLNENIVVSEPIVPYMTGLLVNKRPDGFLNEDDLLNQMKVVSTNNIFSENDITNYAKQYDWSIVAKQLERYILNLL